MRPWRPQIRSASAVRIQSSRVPARSVSSWRNSTPQQLPAIVASPAKADGDGASAGSGDASSPSPGDERQPRPLPSPPPPQRIENRGVKNRGRTFSDETLAKMSRAKEGKIMPLETRLKISASRKGACISEETKERMAETRRKWWANERKARRKLAAPSKRGGTLPAAPAVATAAAAAAKEGKTGKKGKGLEFDALSSLDDEMDADPLDYNSDDFSLDPASSLDLERAVAELSGLRAEVSAWISAFSAASGGRMPTRADAERSPVIYRKFIRFIALQDIVRSARGGGGGGKR